MMLCRACAFKYTSEEFRPLTPVYRRQCDRCTSFTLVTGFPDATPIKGTPKSMDIVVIADRRQLISTPADVAELLANPLKGFVVMQDGLTGERFEVSTADSEDPIGNPNGLDFIIIGRKP